MNEANNKAVMLIYRKGGDVKVATLDINDVDDKIIYSGAVIKDTRLDDILGGKDAVYVATDVALNDLTDPNDPEQVELLVENTITRSAGSLEKNITNEIFRNNVLSGIMAMVEPFKDLTKEDIEKTIKGLSDKEKVFVEESVKFLKDLVGAGVVDFDIKKIETILKTLNSNKK